MAKNNPEHEPSSRRTTVRRGAKRARYDLEEVRGILRDGFVAHVGVMTDEGPLVLPMIYGITEDTMYLHGALANSLLKASADAEVCATVTIVDGLVFAKTPFNSSMNYRSVVVRGRARMVTDPHEHLAALQIMTDHVVPNWEIFRTPSDSEIRSTRVIALPLDEMSGKVRSGGAVNEPEDTDAPFWSGHVPLRAVFGEPIANDDAIGDVPDVIAGLTGRDAHRRN